MNITEKPSKGTLETSAQRAWCEWWLERGVHMALLEFCAVESGRYAIAEPFVVGDTLYATDGRCLVRQRWPVHADILSQQSPEVNLPPVERFPWPKVIPDESQPIPMAFPAFGARSGDFDEQEEQTLSLSRPPVKVFDFADCGLASHFSMRLRSLGARNIYRINKDHKTPFYVPIEDGVDALVMPCKIGWRHTNRSSA